MKGKQKKSYSYFSKYRASLSQSSVDTNDKLNAIGKITLQGTSSFRTGWHPEEVCLLLK